MSCGCGVSRRGAGSLFSPGLETSSTLFRWGPAFTLALEVARVVIRLDDGIFLLP